MMKKAAVLSTVIIACISLSCAPSIRSVRQWIDSKKTQAGFDITGRWDAGSVIGGGWGGAVFVQTEDRFIGTMGLYNVEGLVSGNSVYMMILSGNGVRYTAILSRRDDGSLAGSAVEKSVAGTPGAAGRAKYPIILKKEAGDADLIK